MVGHEGTKFEERLSVHEEYCAVQYRKCLTKKKRRINFLCSLRNTPSFNQDYTVVRISHSCTYVSTMLHGYRDMAQLTLSKRFCKCEKFSCNKFESLVLLI